MLNRTFRFIRIAGLLLFPACSILFAQSNTSGVDCECSAIGGYIDPVAGRPPAVVDDSMSPGGKYVIRYSGSTVINVYVVRVSNGTTVYTASFPEGSTPQWGFSPDGDRFATHYTTGSGSTSMRNLALIDLTKTSGNPIWAIAFPSLSDRIGFTPNGNYLYYNAVHGSNQVHIEIVDAQNGAIAYETDFSLPTPPAEDGKFGMATWGFSPDARDRSFVYAYLSSANYYQWYLVNLQSRAIVKQMPLSAVAGFWRFSPCGDVLGTVIQPAGGGLDVNLYKTLSTQSGIGSLHRQYVEYVFLRSTDSSHIANSGGSDYTVASNYAGGVCTLMPVSMTVAPDSVVGGDSATGTVTLNGPAFPGSLDVTLSSGDTARAKVPSHITIPAGDAEATFTVTTKACATAAKVAVSASTGGVTLRDTLHVLPITVSAFRPDSMDVYGGDSLEATVVINHPAPHSGITVKVVTGNSAVVEVPSSVTVPEDSVSRKFIIRTREVESAVKTTVSVITGSDTIQNPFYLDPLAEVFAEPLVVVGGNSTGIYLKHGREAPAGGLSFPVASSNTAIIASAALTLSEGAKNAGLSLSTTGVRDTQQVVLSTTVGALIMKDTVTVLPADLVSNGALSDSCCTVGQMNGSGKMYLAGIPILYRAVMNGKVPPEGADVALVSSRPDILPVPSPTLHFDSASDRASYVLYSSDQVSSPQQVIITASYRETTLTDTVTIICKLPYTLVILDSSGWESTPKALTGPGDVMLWGGEYSTSIWHQGQRTGCPYGVGLNDSGQIISSAYQGGDPSRHQAVIISKDTFYIPHPDSTFANCYGRVLNNHADAAFYAETPVPRGIPARIGIWRNGTVTLAGPVEDYWLDPTDINDNGMVVGFGVKGWNYIPVVWNGGDTLSVIRLPGNARGKATAVNNAGVIVGTAGVSWFLSESGAVSVVPPVRPWYLAEATDINDSGVVVGTMTGNLTGGEGTTVYTPFVFLGGFMYDLNCMVDLPEGWSLETALKINNAGEIAVTALYGNVSHACILRPGTAPVISAEKSAVRLPTSFSLEQNYPNPFRPATMFRYQLPVESKVTLKIYTPRGQLVATLVNGHEAAGYRAVVWGPGSMGSGIYLYKLIATPSGKPGKTFTCVKKMLLNR